MAGAAQRGRDLILAAAAHADFIVLRLVGDLGPRRSEAPALQDPDGADHILPAQLAPLAVPKGVLRFDI